jgi:hypothetical protein
MRQFDDIPTLSVAQGTDPNSVKPEPLPLPHHRFGFLWDFVVMPPPSAPYLPSSGRQFIRFNPSRVLARIDLDPLKNNPCFYFNFRGISVGCNSTDLPCEYDISGLQWNGNVDVIQGNKVFTTASCPAQSNCTLLPLDAESVTPSPFQNLTAITIKATSGGQPTIWWADDVKFDWTENTCEAAQCRSKIPNTIMHPAWKENVMKPSPFLRRATRRHIKDA